jgi:uncharacterized RDD family membrane protein YckC
MPFDQPIGPRAGYWQRFLALLVDYIIVSLPFQLIAVLLFVATSGFIQLPPPVNYGICTVSDKVPDTLVPPPPAGANFAKDCSLFFGAQTGRTLQVGHVNKEGVESNTKTYLLDRDGRQVNGVLLDWLPSTLFFVVYLIMMETRTGATFGDRWLRLRVIDQVTPDVSGVPLRKILTRYLVLAIGSAPMLVFLFIYSALIRLFLKEVLAGAATWLILSTVPWCVWNLVILVQIVRKRDPLYDRIAGTAVVRV